jgi:hypothetical protein
MDCRVAATQRQFIPSAAAGGVEGLLAMAGCDHPPPNRTSIHLRLLFAAYKKA